MEPKFKRPIPQRFRRGCASGGGVNLAYGVGRASDIARLLLRPMPPPTPSTPWTPPSDYEFIAKHMSDDESRDLFLARCRSWEEANPRVPPPPPVVKVHLNMEPIYALQRKYTDKRPPIEESIVAWRAAGLSEDRLVNMRAWNEKMEATTDKRQEIVDKIFAKYPSANKSKVAQKVKKIIRAVKKKIVVDE